MSRRTKMQTTRTTVVATLLCSIIMPSSLCIAFAPSSRKSYTKLSRAVPLFLSSSSSSSTDSSSSSSSQERDDLLKKALQLRQEARELESKLKRKSSTTTESSQVVATAAVSMQPPPAYNSLNDSVWLFSYRFTDQPESRNKNVKDTTTTTTTPPARTFYTGKLTLKLRSDGFTDIVSHEATSSLKLDLVKAWGWDCETSDREEDNNKDYVMFSVDGIIPAATKGPTVTQRFYFQARQESTASGIALKEGTVTVKQDVIDSKAPIWGLFSPRGILAEFRRVGDFSAKPTRVAVEE